MITEKLWNRKTTLSSVFYFVTNNIANSFTSNLQNHLLSEISLFTLHNIFINYLKP